MKKLITLLITTGIALVLISCGTTPKQEPVKPAEPSTTTDDNTPSKPTSDSGILIDDFEEGNFFDPVGTSWGDGDVSLKCSLSTDWGTEGGTSLKCTVTTKGAEWEKGGFFTTPYETDWTGMSNVSLDIYNPNDFEIGISVVLQDGENWEEWNQFEGQTVEANSKTTLIFEIPSKKYLDCIQRVIVYSWGPVPQECSFYIDNIVANN